MKQYEEYKDSGIQWWGIIPDNWCLSKAKHMFSLVNENVSSPDLPKVALENIESWTGRYTETANDFMGEGVEFHPNDILFGKLRPYLAKVYKAEFKGQSVGDIYVFRGNENQDPGFLKYLFLSYPFISVVDGSTYGAKMPRANWDFISQMILPCPPLSEQQSIASYLDYKVGQIDTVISEKEKMLEDLKAYRSAVISEAVTKGLDKNVEMKDSGIEWIGMIPKHWEIVKMSWIYPNIGSGTTPDTNNIDYYSEDGYNWLQTGDLNDGYITATSKHITEKAVRERGMRIYPQGSLVIAMYGATIGKVGLLQIDTTTNQACCVLPPNAKMSNVYTKFVLQAAKDVLLQLSNGGGQPNISQSVIKSLLLPMPDITEQAIISQYLQNKFEHVDTVLAELISEISDLKSYKSSLITEAVTGKIDLRDWKK